VCLPFFGNGELIMDVVSPRREHAPALHRLYLGSVAAAPHCRFTPDAGRFAAELLGAAPSVPLFSPPRELELLVAEEGGAACGFASFARYKEWEGGERQAITALFFEDEAAAAALLRSCEALAAGDAELLAFPDTHGKGPVAGYNCGWNGLSDRIPHLARVLARAGYRPYQRELHLSCDLGRLPPGQPSAPAGVELHEEPDERGRLWLRAFAGGRKVGDCVFSTLAQLAPAAGRTGYVWGLGVDEGHRRQGLARCLMGRALTRLAELGCEACWLTTTADNWPAQPLYLSLGFEVVDCSASFRLPPRGERRA
jgi:ribosomal protein S18 acetylase RimI-like enzyme